MKITTESYSLMCRTAWRILDELYNEQTREVARSHGLLLIDLAQEIPKSTEMFYDRIHFSEIGADQVAASVARALGPHLSMRYPESALGDG